MATYFCKNLNMKCRTKLTFEFDTCTKFLHCGYEWLCGNFSNCKKVIEEGPIACEEKLSCEKLPVPIVNYNYVPLLISLCLLAIFLVAFGVIFYLYRRGIVILNFSK